MLETKVLTAHISDPHQCEIDTYEKNGGYLALKKALQMKPEALVEIVKESNLRGRGGAGFVTGKKWGFLPKDRSTTYLVCNCDESEPGTFKDRYLIENDPHQLIEGIIISSYAIGAKLAFIYCRGEFFEGLKKLKKAVQEAYKKGYLGTHLDIIVHPGAGAYIAGEETALLNSLEGYRATPRLKPPFPAVAGLYGKPTIINNVETLCNVVHIVKNGVEWYKSLSTSNNCGTKIFQISGHIQNPGCYEFPFGITLQELIDYAGGMLDKKAFKACYPGGSSCALLTKADLNIPLDFETLTARNSAIGTASIIIMDETTDMVKVAHRLMQFYQNESCGKCTPCREGTRWVVQILERIENGFGTFSDLKTIVDVCLSMENTSFCPLAVGASFPIVSAIKEFLPEFEAAIRKNPSCDQKPDMLISYPYLCEVT